VPEAEAVAAAKEAHAPPALDPASVSTVVLAKMYRMRWLL
jgi:hypothetical protein